MTFVCVSLPADSPSGSACDGETDARVLVRQPARAPHGPQGQENLVSAVGGHHRGQGLVGLVGLLPFAAAIWTEVALYWTQWH